MTKPDPVTLGKARSDIHRRFGNQTKRLHSNRYTEDVIGAHGEICFAEEFNLEVRPVLKHSGGDDGYDFDTPIGKIDVKTFQKPYNLLVKVSEIHGEAEFYVLGRYLELGRKVIFLGWATKAIMLKCPTKIFHPKSGILNHYLAANSLNLMSEYPMSELIIGKQGGLF